MNSKRLAAYRFSTLHKADQRWVFSRLTAAERRSIRQSLKQLKGIDRGLNIPFDELLSCTALQIDGAASPPAGAATVELTPDHWDARQRAAVFDQLSPAFLVAFFKAYRELEPDYTRLASPARTREIAAAVAQASIPPAPAVKKHMQRIVVGMLEQHSGGNATAPLEPPA